MGIVEYQNYSWKQKWADQAAKRAAEETKNPDWQVCLAEAAANMRPSDLADYLVRVPNPYPLDELGFMITRFLDFYEDALCGVPCPWRDMFNESCDFDQLIIQDLLSYFPESVYQTSVDWLHQHVSEELLYGYVLWSFHFIICDLFRRAGGVFYSLLPTSYQPGHLSKSEVSIFVTLAMLVRSKPHALTEVLPDLRLRSKYHGPGQIPLTVWLISLASRDNICVGLYSWAHNLLPLALEKPQSRDLILKLVEKILATPDAQNILLNAPVWKGKQLIPPGSFGILMRLTFPDTAAREEATSRFEAIFPLLKEVAMNRTLGSETIKQLFTVSLKLSGKGEALLAKEATSIAEWSLTKNIDCWKHWVDIFEKYLKSSIDLLRKLVLQCHDRTQGNEAMIQQIFDFCLELASKGCGRGFPALEFTAIAISSMARVMNCWRHMGREDIYGESVKAFLGVVEKWNAVFNPCCYFDTTPQGNAVKQVNRYVFTISLRVAGEGNPGLAEEATSVAVLCLTKNVDNWTHWEDIFVFKKYLKASIALLTKLVGQCEDSTQGNEAMIEDLFSFSLKLAGQGKHPVLPQKATSIAIWSLTIVVDYWKHSGGNIFEEKLKAFVALLKQLVENWNDHSVKLSSSSPRDKRLITRNIFTFCLKFAGQGSPVLAEEATSIAIWSLNEYIGCWSHWNNLYEDNLKASVALLKKLVEKSKNRSLKLSSSPSDTLTRSQTMKNFMLKNKKAVTERGLRASLYKEADESCKVILLPRGSSSLKE